MLSVGFAYVRVSSNFRFDLNTRIFAILTYKNH